VQSHLVAAVLKTLIGAADKSEADVQLTRLARRIADNRVVAGLHYPEDIDAGKPLGEALARYFLFKAQPLVPSAAPATSAVNWLWTKAYAEWH
jgi:hypothetical protein